MANLTGKRSSTHGRTLLSPTTLVVLCVVSLAGCTYFGIFWARSRLRLLSHWMDSCCCNRPKTPKATGRAKSPERSWSPSSTRCRSSFGRVTVKAGECPHRLATEHISSALFVGCLLGVASSEQGVLSRLSRSRLASCLSIT